MAELRRNNGDGMRRLEGEGVGDGMRRASRWRSAAADRREQSGREENGWRSGGARRLLLGVAGVLSVRTGVVVARSLVWEWLAQWMAARLLRSEERRVGKECRL